MEILVDWFFQYGWKVLLILTFVAGMYWLIHHLTPPVVKSRVRSQMKGKPEVEMEKRADTLIRVIRDTSTVALGILALFVVLDQIGINITAALAGLGVVGIAVGLGAQALIRDIISGFLILLENQYGVGDVIQVGNLAGLVEEITLRRTILRDLDGARTSIPNGEIRTVRNLTQEWSRAHLNIAVAYKEDVDRVMAVMRKIWEEMAEDSNWSSFIISTTPSLLRVDEFGDSGIVIKLVGETQPIRQWDVMAEFRRRVKRVFDEEGIEIPWPHTKVYFGNSPGGTMPA